MSFALQSQPVYETNPSSARVTLRRLRAVWPSAVLRCSLLGWAEGAGPSARPGRPAASDHRQGGTRACQACRHFPDPRRPACAWLHAGDALATHPATPPTDTPSTRPRRPPPRPRPVPPSKPAAVATAAWRPRLTWLFSGLNRKLGLLRSLSSCSWLKLDTPMAFTSPASTRSSMA